MTPIPKDAETREQLIRLHAACMESMKGVAGSAAVLAEPAGDVTAISGGVLDDDLLRRVLIRMRAQPPHGKLVLICTKPNQEWRIARLAGVRGVLPGFADERVFADPHSAQHAIFVMRLDEMAETDGMPEHFNEAWKRRAENWA